MTPRKYIDILIVSALREEQFLLDKVFPDNLGRIFKEKASVAVKETGVLGVYGKRAEISFFDGKSLVVGWATLGSGQSSANRMGNLFAYDACARLAEQFSPRCILLFGVAGGSKSTFARGDVGYGIQTGYSTFCKLESEPHSIRQLINESDKINEQQEKNRIVDLVAMCGVSVDDHALKYTPRPIPLVPSSPSFCAAADDVAQRGRWQEHAKKWFTDLPLQKEFLLSAASYDLGLNRDDKLVAFARDTPQAAKGLVASGDAIIANKKLQEKISASITYQDASEKFKFDANMFDMESFGVGLFCDKRSKKSEIDLHYGMIKGICDLAGEDKDDRYRFCALASATSFLLDVITEESFYKQFIESKAERLDSGKSACLWPKDTLSLQRCVTTWDLSEANTLSAHRPCTDSGLAGLNRDSELQGARLFHDTESSDYSQCVTSFLNTRIGYDSSQMRNRLLLLFPYSIHDLLNFFRNMNPGEAGTPPRIHALGSYMPRGDSTREERKKIKGDAIYLGDWAHKKHTHFREANAMCARWIAAGKTFNDISEKICRVICIPNEDRVRAIHDPRYLLYPFMCGPCVPTLIASESVIRDYGADEATYFNFKPKRGRTRGITSVQDMGVTLCLKYADRSKLLAIIGRCDQVPEQCSNLKAFKLFETFEKWIGEQGRAHHGGAKYQHFMKFPMFRLLSQYRVNWRANDLLVPGFLRMNKGERQKVISYINDVKQQEEGLFT